MPRPDHPSTPSGSDTPAAPELSDAAVVGPRPPERPWALGPDAVAAALVTDLTVGLTPAEAAARLASMGPNELADVKRRSRWRMLASQFANTMIVVLIVAGVVTALLGDIKDTIVIAAIVALNGIVGFIQEDRAEEAMPPCAR